MIPRMTARTLFAILIALAALAFPARGQADSLAIRLVKAGQGSEIDPALEDVATLMRGNLAFTSFKLIESTTVPLPASGAIRMGGQFKVALSGPAENLDITVSRAGANLIKTRAVIKGRSPLVLGGIPTRDGTLLFVLTRTH